MRNRERERESVRLKEWMRESEGEKREVEMEEQFSPFVFLTSTRADACLLSRWCFFVFLLCW